MSQRDEPDDHETSAEKRERERLRRARCRVGVSSLPHEQSRREHCAHNLLGAMKFKAIRRRREDA